MNIDEHFSLHDARITRIQCIEKGYDRTDIVLVLNTKHSYTKAKRIVFSNAQLRIHGAIDNAWWIWEEINAIENGYKMEVMVMNGETDEYSFLTIEFRDLLVEQ